MEKFNIASLLSDKSKEGRGGNTFKIKNINISKIVPDQKNFYSVSDVTELKESILLFGLQQNLVVRENPEEDTYTLISGHRRLKALSLLIEEGHEEFETVPCKVETNLDEIKAELQLIFANATSRELTDYERTHQAIRIKELLTALKRSGVKLPGRMREIVADTLKVSPTQVGRMEAIEGNLSPEFKEEFKDNKVNFSTAYELSGLPEEKQKEAYQEYKEKGAISINDVKTKKSETKPQEPQPVPPPEAESPEVTRYPDPNLQAKKIYICSPYGGKEENYIKAVEYCRDVAEEGHIPFASHVMLHNILNDEEGREKGIIAGLQMIKLVDELWVFGGTITKGMHTEISAAKCLKKPVIYKDGEDNAEE